MTVALDDLEAKLAAERHTLAELRAELAARSAHKSGELMQLERRLEEARNERHHAIERLAALEAELARASANRARLAERLAASRARAPHAV